MSSDECLAANNWEVPDQDCDYLTEEAIDAIMSEAPESDAYSDAELAEMAADYLARHAA